ncbi:MAG TPA: PE-PPE domain-containing protein [Mycobacterium sp.]|nr:PE-PPE domain-containing protein [Mycobacterium sp.]
MSGLGKRLTVIASVTVAVLTNVAVAHAAGTTYTLEPFDYDDVGRTTMNITQQQLGGTVCPCVKIPYPADGLHNAQGVAAIAKTPLKAGDTVMGFSLGAQVVALYLAQNSPPPGVRFILLGDTFNHNSQMAFLGQGVPANVADQVILMVRQYDGWTDYPDITTSPNFQLSWRNAQMGAAMIHDYVNARLDNSANVVTTRGNITAILVPTQHLPLNDMQRLFGPSPTADALDAKERPLVDSAYSRPGPTAAQLAASTSEQAATL